MGKDINILKIELQEKEKRFEEKYVLNNKNDYLSEEAEIWRKEIWSLRSEIIRIQKGEKYG